MKTIRIGTRASKLALWQAHHVQNLLQKKGCQVEIVKITTKGDQILDQSLSKIGGKGLFLKEIEEALLQGEVDIAVHSMKDVPYELPNGLVIPSILKREDPSDAFVSVKYQNLNELPKKAVIGTSSLRRSVQLKKLYPHLQFQDLRGNVDTRLKKLVTGEFDAIILASAGLIRLGLDHHINERLKIIPAVAQGAIGIECRETDSAVVEFLQDLNHAETFECVSLERLFLQLAEGSCTMPIGCFVEKEKDVFSLKGFFANPDGSNFKELRYRDDIKKLQLWLQAQFGK